MDESELILVNILLPDSGYPSAVRPNPRFDLSVDP